MSISPNIPSAHESYGYESAGTPRWISVLFGLMIAGLAVVVYFGYTTQARLSDDLLKQRDQGKILSVQLDQANSRIADLKSQVEITTQRMGLTQSELEGQEPGGRHSQRAASLRPGAHYPDQGEPGTDWRGGKRSRGREEGPGSDQDGPGGHQREAGPQHGRHERDERVDRPQPR